MSVVVFYNVFSIVLKKSCCYGIGFVLLLAIFSLLYSKGPTMCLSYSACSLCQMLMCRLSNTCNLYPLTNIMLTFIANVEVAFMLCCIVSYCVILCLVEHKIIRWRQIALNVWQSVLVLYAHLCLYSSLYNSPFQLSLTHHFQYHLWNNSTFFPLSRNSNYSIVACIFYSSKLSFFILYSCFIYIKYINNNSFYFNPNNKKYCLTTYGFEDIYKLLMVEEWNEF